MEVKYYNSQTLRYENEQIFAESSMNFLFQTIMGKFLMKYIFSCFWFSKIYANRFSQPKSCRLIDPFIKKYHIDLNLYESNISYQSFNDFFIRKFKKNLRFFPTVSSEMGAPCEAKYFAYQTNSLENNFPVKGKNITPKQLLGPDGERWYHLFNDGPLVVARLAPVDYHRFHFFDDGEILDSYSLGTKLFSVHPLSLKIFSKVFLQNYRCINILQTKNFGIVAYIEVGALTVGKIIQSHVDKIFHRGQEKGYFLFGGSTVVILGQKNNWTPLSIICEQTKLGFETFIPLGGKIADSST